jgi:hypothetical protein
MLVLEIEEAKIRLRTRSKTLATLPLESYSAKYVEFVVRTTLAGSSFDASSISAIWNAKEEHWEGCLKHKGQGYSWILRRFQA